MHSNNVERKGVVLFVRNVVQFIAAEEILNFCD